MAAEAGKGPSEVIFLVQILLLLTAGRLLGELMQRIGQPAVMGQLIAGILLGPSVFGALLPDLQKLAFPDDPAQKAMINAVSQLGILLLLLVTGMETDLKLVRHVRKAATSVSIAGIAVPFACGFALGEALPEAMLPRPELRLITSLFLGTALSISSVKIVAMVVREMNFMRRNIGQVIVASAIIDDTIGWVIIALTFSLALHGSFDAWSLGKSVVGVVVFMGLSFTIGRRLVFLVIRWTNDNFRSELPVLSAILAIMGLMALATHWIGVHTVLGAFVAGMLVGQSPILTRQIDEQLRGLITALFMPVFFGLAGLSADLTILADPRILMLTGLLILIASIGKFGGAFIGGTFGGLSRPESLALALGMNARGSTEVIVASIGLSMGALSHDLFTMIVAMAVITTLAMPPSLRWALARLPLTEPERLRMEKERAEATGFVPRLERILVATDESANGIVASRLAGLVAGLRAMPVTVLPLADKATPSGPVPSPAGADLVGEAAKSAAESAAEAEVEKADVIVATRQPDAPAEVAVASEGAKGYGILMVGVDASVAPDGGFSEELTRIADSFAGPIGIVVTNGVLGREPHAGLALVAPVSGTDVSLRGAEVAVALARAGNAPITAVYVPPRADPEQPQRRLLAGRRPAESVLKSAVALADHYHVALKTVVSRRMAREEAVLKQVRQKAGNLVVLGVTRRPGERLDFGTLAHLLVQSKETSILFIVS